MRYRRRPSRYKSLTSSNGPGTIKLQKLDSECVGRQQSVTAFGAGNGYRTRDHGNGKSDLVARSEVARELPKLHGSLRRIDNTFVWPFPQN